MSDTRAKVESLRERIQDSNEISEEDREALLQFSDTIYLLKSEYTDYRHDKLLRHCTRIAEQVGGLADSLEDRGATEDIVRWINQTYTNEYTNHDYRTALRVFGRRVSEDSEIPDSIEWVPSGTSSSHDPVPNPSEMLKWEEDVLPMIEETRNARDAALIAVAFDAGARSGELQDLTVGDVTDAKNGLRIFVDGKMGQRSVLLIPSVPYLQRWLSDHPGSDDGDAPLWSKLSKSEELTYRRFRSIFDDVARRAGVTKPVTPTNFRKSNASWLAEKGMNQAYIEDRQGRKRGSDATAHYVARFGGEAEDEYARMQGVEVDEEEPEPIGPVECPRCGRDTPRHEPACVWCNQAISHAGIQSLDEQQQEVRDALFRFAQEKPELIEDFKRARDLTDLLENNPDLFGDAQEFVDALSES
ncbi:MULTISPECIES: tyrosine-type recombinase/integrase [unclassified Haloferax]|uniref:tyrosine-type recombinase/integrase n=1 Tax=unclassified Haloferax TaxID=2625095 RepID=UPI0028740143|nr:MULTISPECIES: tyrosine-type recombinase/integrase [unclassified Haloferax]MDS0243042.1 site-specific integrase [Haloferax sp. S2CR25]MDS0446163.1 site-specific integrase [Haloferax sp. S2CR25-2]